MPICLEKHGQNTAETAGISASGGRTTQNPLQKRQGVCRAKYGGHVSNIALLAGLKRLGLSVARFAELIGKPERVVYEWSRGAARPTQEAMTILAMIEELPGAREWLEARNPREVKPRGRPFKSRWGRQV